MRLALLREPEVRGISKATGLDPFAVVGRLYAIWSYTDEVTKDGRIEHTERADIDEIVGHEGFADAMVSVKWLTEKGGCVIIPNFDRHNGKSAKSRDLASKRVAKHRSEKRSCNGASVTSNAGPVTVDRIPEKRREEKSTHIQESASESDGLVPHKGIRVNPYEVSDKILDGAGWPKGIDRRSNARNLVAHALLALADGAEGDDAAANPIDWLGNRMAETVKAASTPVHVPDMPKWFETRYPHLAASAKPFGYGRKI